MVTLIREITMKFISKLFILFTVLLSAEQLFASSSTTPYLKIGDYYQGGVIFWLDPTQQDPHGLIVDVKDQIGSFAWDTSSSGVIGAIEDGAYAGKNNTSKIQTVLSANAPGAMACINSNSGNFHDWYLPSVLELTTIFSNQMTIYHTAKLHEGADLSRSSSYWSSVESQSNPSYALTISGGLVQSLKKQAVLSVRCIRSF